MIERASSDPDHVCSRCGRRQPKAPSCSACAEPDLLDLTREQTRELLLDIDQRGADRRETRLRYAGVTIGITSVVGLWCVPGYWDVRGLLYPGLPFLADQWAAMIGIGLLSSWLLGRAFPYAPRFPFVDANGDLTR